MWGVLNPKFYLKLGQLPTWLKLDFIDPRSSLIQQTHNIEEYYQKLLFKSLCGERHDPGAGPQHVHTWEYSGVII